eukprot:5028081-Pyramimonas_sp.AAC.2
MIGRGAKIAMRSVKITTTTTTIPHLDPPPCRRRCSRSRRARRICGTWHRRPTSGPRMLPGCCAR